MLILAFYFVGSRQVNHDSQPTKTKEGIYNEADSPLSENVPGNPTGAPKIEADVGVGEEGIGIDLDDHHDEVSVEEFELEKHDEHCDSCQAVKGEGYHLEFVLF